MGDLLSEIHVPLRRMLLDACPVGVAITRIDAANGVHYVAVNDAFAALLGRSVSDFAGRPIGAMVHADDLPRLQPHHTLAQVAVEGAYRHHHADGGVRHLRIRSAPLREAGLAEPHYVSYATDVSSAAEATGQAEGLSVHDDLTGLLTRRGFELELALVGEASGVIVFGLDGFTEINGTYGSEAGDSVLRATAEILRARFPPPAVLARLGGDEFGVLLRREAPDAAACHTLGDLRDTFIPVGDERIRVTASAGVRCWGATQDPLAEAALALAEAKELGRDRLVIDRDGSPDALGLRERRRLSDRVRRALADTGFEVHEQPIVRLRDREVVRTELLLRLRDEDGTLIPPDAFLPAAERSGQIRAIDRWVLSEAIDLLAARQAVGEQRRLHVNLSGASLVDADTVDAIVARLRDAPVDPSGLTFEVTETAAVRQMQVAERLARQLAELGCGFAVDDFGTGWASFSYLKHLPVTVLKIDGSFVRGLVQSQRDRTTVRAMVDIAREYRIQTVAECVEHEATAELLQELGVDLGQGYHLGRPGPVQLG